MNQLGTILWAQWLSVRGAFPRSGVWTYLIGALWYGAWLAAALFCAKVVADPSELGLVHAALPGALVLVVLYWQVVPILMSATGASLDLQKLKVYPIRTRHLFGIEVLLRATSAVEMLLVLTAASIGSAFNPRLPLGTPLAIVPFIVFNLFLAVGIRDVLRRLLRHKRVRELGVLLLVTMAAIPSFLATRAASSSSTRIPHLFAGGAWRAWPWTATAGLIEGVDVPFSLACMSAWCIGAALFGAVMFRWTYASDREDSPAEGFRSSGRNGVLETFFRWPSLIFSDPLAALAEKEMRFLARSPRFRLVFLMGFTFGLVIWLPISLGQTAASRSFLGTNYLTVVSVYSLLLLSEVCFWNSFGFDRSAAQIYFLAPVPFWLVLAGKNVSALFFIAFEVASITVVCAIAGMPLSLSRMAEAYSVAAVIALFLLGAGNLLSVQQARGVNPDTTFRSGASGRIQAMLFVIYPVAFFPVSLAYVARYAFDSELAFYGVLTFDAVLGAIVYKLALDSAVAASERGRERMIAALSQGDGPIAA
jgi:ABC-2 type transport system permease protein